MKLGFKLVDDQPHVGLSGRRGFQRKVLAILLQGEGTVVEMLLGDDGRVEQRRRIIRLLPQRRAELLPGVLVAPALHLHQTQSIHCLR